MDKNITIPKKEIAPGIYTTGGTATMPNNVITPQNLAPETPTQLSKTQPDTTNYGGVIGGVGESIANDLNFLTGKVQQQEQDLSGSQNDISSLIRNISGQGNELLAEQDRQGVNKETEKYNSLQQTLLDLQGQATSLNREAQAIPLQVQAENKNQLATSQRTDVVTTERLRDNALRALSIAQQSDIAFAAATGSQIRLKAAQDKANQIVEMKYAPLKAELEIKKQNYEFNKDILERFDKKRAEALGIALKKEEREIEKAEENEKAIQSIALKIAEFGGNPSIIKNAKTPLEAIQIAGSKLQDPIQKLQMQKLNLDIQKQIRENALIGQPTATEKAAEKKALASKEGQNLVLQDKLSLIDTIKNSSGISTRVGSNILARKPVSFWGGVGKALTGVGIPGLIGGGIKEATGTGQQFSGAVHRLASQEFIDNLIEAKSQGATFGALTDREGDALRAAATQLNDWEIKDKEGKGTGVWNIDEKSFLGEVNRIESLSRKAIGDTFSQDEEQLFDSVFGSGTTLQADPSVYFNK